ncbi:MAG: hypothetical protein F4X12_21380 [Acidobacteriia bacterium]|nr:hypothetical protein [Terriglobia bacterium]
MYTVMIGDDGMFTAEYVQPPALSVPLGISGSTIEARINEDRTFSVMIDGEWVVVTADTQVTAGNGNVYGVQFVDGIPMPVYTGHSQPVMLGELGGEVTLTRAEDMTWWLGETEVKDGYVHTAADGNMYVLMMDAEGMWTAMYQKVVVTFALGTQGSITLERAENMSWWYGSEEVGIGSEVMSDNGNTYTLWYTDGVWSARFEPESMMVEGTGLVAMTNEANDLYTIGGNDMWGPGDDVTDGDAMYHVWKRADGTFAGARFDGKIGNTNLRVSDLDANVALSADNEKGLLAAMGYGEDVTETEANEANAYLKVAGDYYSIGTLLGSGSAKPVGGTRTIVEDVKAELESLLSEAEVLISVFDEPGQAGPLQTAMNNLWDKARDQIERIFGDTLDIPTTPSLRNDRVLDDLNDYIAALASEEAFADATAAADRGVFAAAELSSADAAKAFVALQTESGVALRSLGNMRFGAAWKMTRTDATEKLMYEYVEDDPGGGAGQLGAFAYSTINKETRVANIDQGTGSASYMGQTQAVDGSGTFVSGDITLQVRFNANEVTGEISNLVYDSGDNAGDAWQYLYANVAVDSITLPAARLRTHNASWSGSGLADVNYVTIAGSPRPNKQNTTFAGQLLQGGNEAIGTWTFGDNPNSGKTYLAGAFGAERGDDVPDFRPDSDDGTGMATTFVTRGDPITEDDAEDSQVGQVIAGGMLKITVPAGAGAYDTSITEADDRVRVHEVDLAKEFGRAGATQWGSNGEKFSALATKTLESQRDIIALDLIPEASKITAWDAVRTALATRIFNLTIDQLPGIFAAQYSESGSFRNEDYVRAIDEAIDALASAAALRTALSHTTGIFYTDATVFDNETNTAEAKSIYQLFGTDSIPPTTNGSGGGVDINLEKTGDLTGRQDSRVQLLLGTTSFTRFGVWRREVSTHARQGPATQHSTADTGEGQGPNAFGYSQLSQTVFESTADPAFPNGAVLNYVGETVAVQHKKYFSGTINIEVNWTPTGTADNPTTWGTLSAVISGLEDVASGLPLYFDSDTGDNDLTDLAGDDVPAADLAAAALSPVRQIVIAGVNITDTDGKLGFSDSTLDFTGSTTGSVGIVHGSLGSRAVDIGGGTVEGKFLGIGLNGPLAVLGGWSIANANNNIGAEQAMAYREAKGGVNVDINGVDTNVVEAVTARVGSVTVRNSPIIGAFGADLP